MVVMTAPLLAVSAAGAEGQGMWDAMLTIQPFPSPYYSDWETNPNIGSLTVMNGTASAADIRVFFTVTDRMNRVVVSGRSEPETIAAGGMVVYDSPYEIAGSTTHDAELERIASRTGRMPEGDYMACAAVTDDAGFVLDESCADFFVAYPDPPLLLGPEDGARLTDAEPLFQWTPAQAPPDYPVSYSLRVVEVLPGQLAGEALERNIPHYELRDAFTTALRYPIDGLPLEPGQTYAWEVRALDPNGYPASANNGRSEIWTFQVDEAEPMAPETNAVLLSVVTADPETGTSESDVVGLEDVCRLWDSVPEAITLPVSVDPAFGPGVSRDTATFYRDPGSRAWAALTRRSRLSYLLFGQCDTGAGRLSGLQWIAVRRSGTLGNLLDGVPIAPGPATELGLRYGVVILSLYPTSTEIPETFTAALDFLDYREIDLRPGLNVFGVVDLKQHALWPLFEALGYTDKYVELQGFAGIDASWSVGGRIGRTEDNRPEGTTDAAGEVSVERTLLYLRAALPEKPPVMFGNLFETSQAALELEVKDSTSYAGGTQGAGSNASLELVLSATLTLTTPGGIAWTGSIGPDFSQDHEAAGAAAVSEDSTASFFGGRAVKTVLKIGADSLPLAGPIYIGDPVLELDVNDGFIDMLRTRDPGRLDWGATLSGALTGGGPLSAKVVVGIGREADTYRGTRPRADADADLRRPTRPRSDADADLQRTGEGSTRRDTDSPADSTGGTWLIPQRDVGGWKWAARIALGNVSLPELFRLIFQSAND